MSIQRDSAWEVCNTRLQLDPKPYTHCNRPLPSGVALLRRRSCEFTPWRLRRLSTNKFQNAPWFPPLQIFTRQLVLLSSETAHSCGLLPFFIMYCNALTKAPRVRFTEIKPSNMHFVFSKLKIPFDKPSPIHRSRRSHHREA